MATGAVAITWYIAHRRNTRVLPHEELMYGTQERQKEILRPKHGETTQIVGTNRAQQQYRTPPPSKKTTVKEME